MKKFILLMALIIIAATSIDAYGQYRHKRNGKWGFTEYPNGAGKVIIPYKYDFAFYFHNGLCRVKQNGKWGFIDKTGTEIIPVKYDKIKYTFNEYGLAQVKLNGQKGFIDKYDNFYTETYFIAYKMSQEKKQERERERTLTQERELAAQKSEIALAQERERERVLAAQEQARISKTFSFFAKNYVEQNINEWQQKGEFERTVDWQQRVNETTRNAKVAELTKEAEKAFITERSKEFSIGNMILGVYDADNETFLLNNSIHGNWLIPVPLKEAPNFRDNWYTLFFTPEYFIDNDNLALAGMKFTTTDGKTYKYSNQASLNHAVAKIDYNFAPIELDLVSTKTTTPQGNQNISTVNMSIGNQSDVARNIPTTNIKNDKTFAVIIANENYQSEANVDFARNDGEVFREYCLKTLGIPENNVHFVADATLNNIRREVNWLSQVANAFRGEINIIFFYAGHGIPDESTRSAYLLPIDGYGSDVSTAYKLDDLYQTLGGLPTRNVTVFLDACFSGSQRSDEMMAMARGVRIKVTPGAPVGNMVVFSAAQGDETAFPYREKGHGMFTYFLLKKLQDSKGDVSLGELGEYIETNVRQQSIIVNKKSQTPIVTPAAEIDENWKGRKLR